MSNKKASVTFTVYGEPASKANQRRLVTNKSTGKTMFIKSSKALGYEKDFAPQCPKLNPMLEGDLSVTMTIYYASHRPDLDESVILDCMQATYAFVPGHTKKKDKVLVQRAVYANDRQVREKHIFWAIDKVNPRAEIHVEEL
jgi:hypothetical protein